MTLSRLLFDSLGPGGLWGSSFCQLPSRLTFQLPVLILIWKHRWGQRWSLHRDSCPAALPEYLCLGLNSYRALNHRTAFNPAVGFLQFLLYNFLTLWNWSLLVPLSLSALNIQPAQPEAAQPGSWIRWPGAGSHTLNYCLLHRRGQVSLVWSDTSGVLFSHISGARWYNSASVHTTKWSLPKVQWQSIKKQ